MHLIRSIFNIIKISYISVALGNLLFLVGIIGTLLFDDETHNLGQYTIGPLVIYLFSVNVGALVAFFLATPIYWGLVEFKFDNYIFISIIGGSISLMLIPKETFYVFLSFSGFIIGPVYHHLYKKSKTIAVK